MKKPAAAQRGGLEALERRELLTTAVGQGGLVPGVAAGTAGFAAVVAERLFYNQSVFDGNSSAAGEADDGAIAPDKVALTAGHLASFLNVSSFVRGINGVMVDVVRLAGTPTAADFVFRTGNSNTPADWTTAAPASVTVRRGAGTGGADRVELTWGSDAVRNAWLEVTMKATATTGLAADEVFYFGSAVGETGDTSSDVLVTSADYAAVQAGRHGPFDAGTVGDPCDFNRDGLVNATDLLTARDNRTTAATGLRLIDLPAVAAPPVVLYRREMFSASPTAVSAVTPSALDQFDGLGGTGAATGFACRPGGPAVTGDFPPGWSGRVAPADPTQRQSLYGMITLAGTPLAGAGFFGAWVRLANYDTSIYWHPVVISLNRTDGAPIVWVRLFADGHLKGGYQRGYTTADGVVDLGAVGQDQWVFVGIGYQGQGGTKYATSFFTKFAGAPAQQTGATLSDGDAMGALQEFRVGSYNAFGEGIMQWTGYVGAAVAGQIGSLAAVSADPVATYASLHITDPDDRPLTWYVNPVTGNDSNDGLAPDRAWKTAAKFNWEAQHMGMFSRGWAESGQGDQVLIDTSGGPLYLSDPLPLTFRGMALKSATSQKADLRAFKAISGMTAYDAAAYPHVWKTTDVQPLSVLWEDRKWMFHVGLARWNGTAVWNAATHTLQSDTVLFPGNITSGSSYNPAAAAMYVHITGGAGITPGFYRVLLTGTDGKSVNLAEDIGPNGATATIAAGTAADAAALLEALPGSYWNDGNGAGATLYFHPSSNGNPNADGIVYERSTYGDLNRYNNAAMVLLAARNTTIQGVKVGGTTTGYSDYGGIQSYVISDQVTDGVSAGTLRVLDSEVFYGGYHVLGFTRSPKDTVYDVENVVAYQASTMSGPTTLVGYGNGSNNTYRWINVSVPATVGLVGSVTGQAAYGLSYISHGSTAHFALIEMRGCSFDGRVLTSEISSPMELADSTFGSVQVTTNATVERVRTTAGAIASTGGLIKRNCVETLLDVAWGNQWGPGATAGVQIWTDNVIDARRVAAPSSLRSLYWVSDATGYSLTFTGNTVQMPASMNVALFGGVVTSASNYGAFTGNIYQMGSNQYMVFNYNDGVTVASRTLAAWLLIVDDSASPAAPLMEVGLVGVPELSG